MLIHIDTVLIVILAMRYLRYWLWYFYFFVNKVHGAANLFVVFNIKLDKMILVCMSILFEHFLHILAIMR